MAALLFLVVLPCLVAEVAFRWLLFSNVTWMKPWRNATLYADYFLDDDHWKLEMMFRGEHRRDTPQRHRELGWVGHLDLQDLSHPEASAVGSRRPVLLYGDSFAECATPECFQHLLNGSSGFSKRCFLLNHGVGAYGLDQSMLLLEKTVDRYPKPFVVFSVMTHDLDRARLSVFGWQKPRFVLEAGLLREVGVPLETRTTEYLRLNPLRIPSLLFRSVRRMGGPPLGPVGWSPEFQETKDLGQALLRRTIAGLRQRKLDFLFLVFVPDWKAGGSTVLGEGDWRLQAILDVLEGEGVPYLSTRDLLRSAVADSGLSPQAYFRGEDGHPNERQNALVAKALEKAIAPCH